MSGLILSYYYVKQYPDGMELPECARLFIIEGIAGSGKSTFHNQLKSELEERGFLIYDFSEEELLFSWKHAWIKGIEEVRLDYMNRLLDYCKEILDSTPSSAFIFSRFHISFDVLAVKTSPKTTKRYKKLIQRVKEMPAHIYVPVLDEHEIEDRCIHSERSDKTWRMHLGRRLETRGFSRLKDMYVWEQDRILSLLKAQGISYTTLRIGYKQ